MKENREYFGEGDYICSHCHIIYGAYGSRLRCDLCNRKLRWRSKEKIELLESKWDIEDRRKGRDLNWAYHPSFWSRTMSTLKGEVGETRFKGETD